MLCLSASSTIYLEYITWGNYIIYIIYICMYIYMCIYIYIYITHMYIHTHIYRERPWRSFVNNQNLLIKEYDVLILSFILFVYTYTYKYILDCIHMDSTKPNSLNYACFREMLICFEYWDIFTWYFILACLL